MIIVVPVAIAAIACLMMARAFPRRDHEDMQPIQTAPTDFDARLERVAQAVGDPTRVLAATDCGFDTSAGMGRVPEDVVWAKLQAMADGAKIATDRLF